jgi:hypothetical protein
MEHVKTALKFVMAALPVAVLAVALIVAWKRYAPDAWKARVSL